MSYLVEMEAMNLKKNSNTTNQTETQCHKTTKEPLTLTQETLKKEFMDKWAEMISAFAKLQKTLGIECVNSQKEKSKSVIHNDESSKQKSSAINDSDQYDSNKKETKTLETKKESKSETTQLEKSKKTNALQFTNELLIIPITNDITVSETSDGELTIQYGDYTIKGTKREFYICKPDTLTKIHNLNKS